MPLGMIMNKIVINKSPESILDEDAEIFYNLVSNATGLKLKKEKDTLFLNKPDELSQNAKDYLIYCVINNTYKVAFKRCMDNPEFIRREKLVSNAKSIIELPNYNLFEITGIILRVDTTTNCSILQGWENKTLLVIDYGNIHNLKPLSKVTKDSIHGETFFCYFGSWLAFNLLFGILDRHKNNFVYSLDGILHSVDNEFGPFDSSGKRQPIIDLVTQMKGVYTPYMNEMSTPIQKAQMKLCFTACWNKIAANLSKFSGLTDNELILLQNTIIQNPETVFDTYFN